MPQTRLLGHLTLLALATTLGLTASAAVSEQSRALGDAGAHKTPDAGKQRPKPQRRYVVAAIGDSHTDPHPAVRGGRYLELLRAKCPQSVFDNYGRGGEMVNQMRRRFARDVLGKPPQPDNPKPAYTHVVVFGGVNDLYSDVSAGRTLADIKNDLSAMYDAARSHGLQVVALTVPPWAGFRRYYNARRGKNTQVLNTWIRSQSREGVVAFVVDAYAILSCGAPEHLCPRYAQSDNLHLSAKGQHHLGQQLLQEVFPDCL